jgi:hypothetical protein
MPAYSGARLVKAVECTGFEPDDLEDHITIERRGDRVVCRLANHSGCFLEAVVLPRDEIATASHGSTPFEKSEFADVFSLPDF